METVLDAYCGIGTIGLIASKHAGKVIGVELNQDAVRDAVQNAKKNGIAMHSSSAMMQAGSCLIWQPGGESADVVFMDPPRSGSTEEFIDAVALMQPKRVVYISCGPDTLARDLKVFAKHGYRAKEAWPVDLFGWTGHVGDCGRTTQKGYVEILEFTHFVEFFSFNRIAENHKEKRACEEGNGCCGIRPRLWEHK